MKNIILLNKNGWDTPLQALEKFRAKHKAYKDAKMTYAGRLDPMASGLLLILAGEETKNKEKYLALPKEYEFEVLFGFSTDTYDILGKVANSVNQDLTGKELEKKIKQNLKHFKGKFTQSYPLYSSKTIRVARANGRVNAPTHVVEVSALKFFKIRAITARNLLKNINKRVDKVNGDFRQKEILKIWQKHLGGSKNKFFIGSFSAKVGSGTYIRSIANDLGVRMGAPALALTIKRTKIGKMTKAR